MFQEENTKWIIRKYFEIDNEDTAHQNCAKQLKQYLEIYNSYALNR